MAFDGFVVAALAKELNNELRDGRIYKITQPEKDEIVLTIRRESKTMHLMISVNPSLPLMYIVGEKKASPLTAPNFCMLLRKYIQNARIKNIVQPGLERILMIEISYRDEMGDLNEGKLIVEMMGKHSNIIFCKEDNTIIDSIKHISLNVSSVREVLPGREYFIPNTVGKKNPLNVDYNEFSETLKESPYVLSKALYLSFTGVSPLEAVSVCKLSSIEPELKFSECSEAEQMHLYGAFRRLMEDVKDGAFSPCIVYEEDEPVNFSAFAHIKNDYDGAKDFASISEMLVSYYAEKDVKSRIRQRSADIRKIVQNLVERTAKKLDLQEKQLKDTEKMDKYRIYGEMINTYGYGVTQGEKSFKCINYYDNNEITIPLDPQIPVLENAKNYFNKYTKLKRTKDALDILLQETRDSLEYLESVSNALDIALNETDLIQIKEELYESGYIKQTGLKKKQKIKNKPMHFVSDDGFDIYVGKNNIQNDELTHKFAEGSDWWFHAKNAAGSHVILKARKIMPPDKTFEQAASLAAYFSKLRDADYGEVDYVEAKHIKKPSKGAPGFVVYYTNYSMLARTDISEIRRISD